MQQTLWKIRQTLAPVIAPRLDIPFARDDANRYLPYFIAMMIFLAAFFLAGGITVGELLADKREHLSDWVTLQVPAAMKESKRKELVQTLSETPGVAETREVEQEEVITLLAPWFGNDAELVKTLEAPRLIDIRLDEPLHFDLPGFKNTLQKKFPQVQIDAHERWIDHYLNFIHLLEMGSYLLALLVVGATTLIIIFTSKTALRLHRNAIELLHSVGAEDEYIARQFQLNAFLLGTRGALLGVAVAATLFFIVGISVNEMNSALLPSFPITWLHLLMWFLLPIVTGLLALFVARKTVLAMLQRIA